jgi:transposase-like protein
MAGRGRPTNYDKKYHPQIVKWMTRSGLTVEQIAGELGLGAATLYRWAKIHEEFREALKEPRDFVDSLVEDSLLKRALGYEVTEMEVVGEGDKRRVKKTVRHIVPDSTAIIFWLKNRRRKDWGQVDGRDDGKDDLVALIKSVDKMTEAVAVVQAPAEVAEDVRPSAVE